jgi:hypothetical protein
VLRLHVAVGAEAAAVRGWLVDAATGAVRDLSQGFNGTALAGTGGRVLPPDELTGTAGGTLTWTAGYDSAFGRFAWHDPLDDLAGVALEGGAVSYLVVGWWSTSDLDPLDGARTDGGLTETCAALGWLLVDGGGTEGEEAAGAYDRMERLGLGSARRGGAQPGAVFGREAGSVLSGAGVGLAASTLVHGCVVGVRMAGTSKVRVVDLRPRPDRVSVVLGEHVDDLVAAALGGQNRAVERLVAAFTAQLLPRLGSIDGVVEVDEFEHARGFASVHPQEPPTVDRVVRRSGQIPPRPPNPQSAGFARPRLTFGHDKPFGFLGRDDPAGTIGRGPLTPPVVPPDSELVERPAPPRYLPADPAVAFAGAGRSLRHGADGRSSVDGRLRCRRGGQVIQGYLGLLDGADVLPALGSGAVPAETLVLAREALLLSPHLLDWLASRVVHLPPAPVLARLAAELGLRFDETGAYTGRAGPLAAGGAGTPYAGGIVGRGDADATAAAVQEILRRHSLVDGVEPDLVAVTAWAQPWIPLWAEYELAVEVADDVRGWRLGAVDLEPAGARSGRERVVTGRVPLTTAPGDALAAAVSRWLVEENQRDRHDQGEADPATEAALAELAKAADGLDLVGATLDGVRRGLLGLGTATVRPRREDGTAIPPTPTGPVDLLAGGTVQLRRIRLVDAYGRPLEPSVETTRVPLRLVPPAGTAATLLRGPRFSAPARCRLRLVGASTVDATAAVDARVDEVRPARQVSPVCGFLLPDHVDESVEVFAADGTPLGELLTEPTGGGVVWEAAPGRLVDGQAVPAGAPPGLGLSSGAAPLGWLAAGMVAADVRARSSRLGESALAAFLRALDTTLWTCDPYAGAGTSALAGIVGRPLAVVRAVLALEVADDLADVTLDEAGRAERARLYAELARVEVPVRLGELTRSDDGLLGFVLDDDFSSVRVVDRVVLDLAREAGRGRGHLRPWGRTPVVPAVQPIRHPYLRPDDEVVLRPGVPRLVTLLMLPGTAVHVTCGVTPRTRVGLARAFFADALTRLVPSVRVGPVLIDPGEVRLPPVAALGQRQVLTYRDGPLAWRDDAILAATQEALLPDHPAVLREGWLRVDPSGEESAP